MGVIVNPGNTDFQQDINSSIYVDKTLIIAELNAMINTRDNKVCMSRPRRFGKSYVGHLICAYYSKGCDSRELLAPYKLAKHPSFEKYLNKLNVISIDMGAYASQYCNIGDEILELLRKKVVAELITEFPTVDIEPTEAIHEAIIKIKAATDEQFVIFIDEYDTLVREKLPQPFLDKYIEFLRSLFKNNEMNSCLALAYVTGLLPIVRDKFGSKMNEFAEYTFVFPEQFAEYMGFTEEETKALCDHYNKDFEECKRWYDGYKIMGRNGITSILAPMSVSRSMFSPMFSNYWSQTGAFQAVNDLFDLPGISIRSHVERLVRGEAVPVNISTYMNTVTDFRSPDDILTYVIYIGYLAYDITTQRCYIPNMEIREQWMNILSTMDDTRALGNLLKASRDLLHDTIALNGQAVAASLDLSHLAVTSKLSFNNEASFQSAIIYAYYYAQNDYTIFKEFPTGKGFADVAFLPKFPKTELPAIIVELKVNKSPDSALRQIYKNQYGVDLTHYKGNTLLVGINYDRKSKRHSCVIEKA